MASWTSRQFPTLDAALNFLNGVIVGTVNLHNDGADVDGLTLVIHDGSADRTVTFAPAKGADWTLDEIISQINATHANLVGGALPTVRQHHRAGRQGLPDRRLSIDGTQSAVATPFTIRAAGTANARLGFSSVGDTTQAVTPDTQVKVLESLCGDPNTQWTVVLYA